MVSKDTGMSRRSFLRGGWSAALILAPAAVTGVALVKGEKGDTGVPGACGPVGPTGLDGCDGRPGLDGRDAPNTSSDT